MLTKAKRDAMRVFCAAARARCITWNEADKINDNAVKALDDLDAKDLQLAAYRKALEPFAVIWNEPRSNSGTLRLWGVEEYIKNAASILQSSDPGNALLEAHAAELAALEKEVSEERKLKREVLDKYANYCIERNEHVKISDALRQRAEAAEAARGELLLLNADAGNALAEMQERYRWRPITEIHEDYGDCVLINVADVGDIQVGSNLDNDFDISRWTHFSRIAPLSGDDYDRMVVDALERPR